jgi:phosphofructokinase-like protein
MHIAILTGGGDCPGLNPAIRAAVRHAMKSYGHQVTGVLNGWQGLIENQYRPLNMDMVSGLLTKGGTILGTSRTNPFKIQSAPEKILKNFKDNSFDALIAIGGEDTLGVASKLYRESEFPVVGIPKTIDNDLSGTDYTFGFYTAVSIATEAIDRLHSTAESHHRIMVVEVMGRHAGWIAVYAGLASGADLILIPEEPFDIEEVCAILRKRHERRDFSIVVVAEGATPQETKEFTLKDYKLDDFGHVCLGGIGALLAREIENRLDVQTRYTILGHIQRGGTPVPFDRILATRYGAKAVELVVAGDFGKMVALQGDKIVAVDMEKAVKKLKTVSKEIYNLAKIFFG